MGKERIFFLNLPTRTLRLPDKMAHLPCTKVINEVINPLTDQLQNSLKKVCEIVSKPEL